MTQNKKSNRRASIAAEQRRQKLLTEPLTSVTKAAEELGVSRQTIYNDLEVLRAGLQGANREEYAEFVAAQVNLLATAVEETWSGDMPPEVSHAVGHLMSSIARLTGSNAPTRTISITAAIEAPVWDKCDNELLAEIITDLDESEIEKLVNFAAELRANRAAIEGEAVTEGEATVIEGEVSHES